MDPIQSWLDAKEVRRMAESLMAPAPEVDESAVDAGYGEGFEGFADTKAVRVSDEKQLILPNIKHDEVASVAVKPRFSQVPREAPQADFPSEIQIDPEPPAPIAEESEPEEITPDESPAEGVGTSARIVVSHALADAKRMAEGSGMISSEAEPPEVEEKQISPVERASLTPQTSSPFQLCDDQSPEEDVPIAQQIEHSESPPQQTGDVLPETPVVVAPIPSVNSTPLAKPSSGAARGPFLTRLKKFSGQLRERMGAKAMFLIDNEGQILIDEVGNTKLVQVARTLANASNTASRQSEGSADVGNLHVKIGASATLEVIPCRSRYGLLILGVVCPSPLGAQRVKLVAEHLAKAIEPQVS